MFEIIQMLRGASSPVTARDLSEALEVSERTIYRDMVALQGQRVPVEGEAGVGYVLRQGYEPTSPHLTAEEVDAVTVGLALLGRTGDEALQRAARSAQRKICGIDTCHRDTQTKDERNWVSTWTAVPDAGVSQSDIRTAIRDHRVLELAYEDAERAQTHRTVKPLGLLYYIESIVLVAWCELRRSFRHFRLDRIVSMRVTDRGFADDSDRLWSEWVSEHC